MFNSAQQESLPQSRPLGSGHSLQADQATSSGFVPLSASWSKATHSGRSGPAEATSLTFSTPGRHSTAGCFFSFPAIHGRNSSASNPLPQPHHSSTSTTPGTFSLHSNPAILPRGSIFASTAVQRRVSHSLSQSQPRDSRLLSLLSILAAKRMSRRFLTCTEKRIFAEQSKHASPS
ncbi:unnamed protein product [Protopolystoma xenopodis]|uniref:Uncharacterized protein n=1 Tax=Protopolystoma xenopodis TaxID=117903 RepID=A0A3S5BUF1_9PLAT|nr:unnamed protein product [Protopolystoma xenopodis]